MPTLNFPSPDVANPGDKVHTGDVTWVFTDKGFWSSEVGEAGGGASVHYGPTAPDSPSQGDLWYADDSTVEFGGRLYIYTGTEWVDTSLPGGGSGDSGGAEVGSLQTVTDNGAVTTNVCEFQGGVNVTGGTYDATAPCIYSTNGSNLNISSLSSQLRLRRENISLASLGVTSSGSATLLNFILKESTGLVSSGGGISTVNINSDQGNYSGFPRVRGYTFQFPRNDGSATDPTTEIIGYSAYPAVTQNENDTSITYYGFRSSLNRGQNYNFYAEGTAPNYFAGLTEHKGGVDVTGSSAAAVPNGIKAQGASGVALTANGADVVVTGANGIFYSGPSTLSGSASQKTTFQGYTISGSNSQKVNNLFRANYDPALLNGSNAQSMTGIQSRFSIDGNVGGDILNTSDIPISFTHFSVSSNAGENDNLNNVKGYNSDVAAGSGTNRWNFYAAGDAPNYFKGTTYIGTADEKLYTSSQSIGLRAVTNSTESTRSAVEISSTNAINNFGKRAINFTKCDYTKDRDSADFKTTAGFIYITSEVGAAAGVIYNCGATTEANGFVSTSDYRLKENFASIDNAVDRIKSLKPKRFNYIGSGNVVDGFVAHELSEGCPAAVFGAKDATEAIGTLVDYDGTVLKTEVTEPSAEELEYTEEVETDGVATMVTRTRSWTPSGTRPVYQGVDQTKLIPLLTKALQETMEKLEAAEARLDAAGL